MTEPARTDFVFLVCSERSGSNLIRVMLDAHSAITAPPPMHLARDICAGFEAIVTRGRESAAWPPLRKRVERRLQRWYDDDLVATVMQRVDALTPLSAGALIRVIYEAISAHGNSRMLLVKENNIQRFLFVLADAFPDARYVFQVRDARDFLVSARNRRESRFGNKFGSTRRALEIWREDQLGGLAVRSHFGPERVFFQRYEDLVSRPADVLTALCGFLGIEFEQTMLSFHEKETTQAFSGRGAQWENTGRPLLSQNFNKYRTELPGWLVAATEAHLGPLLDRFGYTLEHPGKQHNRFMRLLLPHLMEPIEKFANGEGDPFYSDGMGALRARLELQGDAIVPDYPTNREP